LVLDEFNFEYKNQDRRRRKGKYIKKWE